MSNNAISSSLPAAPIVQPKASNSVSGSNSSTSSADSIGSTFLNLLVSELQNQDPTAPMDSTAMVGQMISLNQLNQLTSINQVLSNSFGSTSGTSGVSGQNASAVAKQMPAASNPTSSANDAAYKAMQMLQSGTVPSALTNPYLGGAANLPADTSSPLSLSSLASSLAR